MTVTEHECVFVEEEEPSGRLVLPPCLVCGLTAMDALDQLRREREGAREDLLQLRGAWNEHFKTCDKCPFGCGPDNDPQYVKPGFVIVAGCPIHTDSYHGRSFWEALREWHNAPNNTASALPPLYVDPATVLPPRLYDDTAAEPAEGDETT